MSLADVKISTGTESVRFTAGTPASQQYGQTPLSAPASQQYGQTPLSAATSQQYGQSPLSAATLNVDSSTAHTKKTQLANSTQHNENKVVGTNADLPKERIPVQDHVEVERHKKTCCVLM